MLKSKLLEWLTLRDTTLDEILRHDGLGDYRGEHNCYACNVEPGVFRCKDCLGGGRLRCQACLVKAHRETPLHRIEVSLFVSTIENAKTTSYYSAGLATFSTRFLSKSSISVYNLDTGDAPAHVHLLGLLDSWSSIPRVSMPCI